MLALTFIDEPDRRVEFNLWQYWYNLQANPNQKAFDIGVCVCVCVCVCWGVGFLRKIKTNNKYKVV